jgi:hypothetical protein
MSSAAPVVVVETSRLGQAKPGQPPGEPESKDRISALRALLSASEKPAAPPKGKRRETKKASRKRNDVHRSYKVAWQKDHPTAVKAAMARWRDENASKLLEYRRAYYERNKTDLREKARVRSRLRVQKLRELGLNSRGKPLDVL